MASINASTSGAGGVITTADATGNLELQSGGSAIATVSSTGLSLATGKTLSVGGATGSPFSMKNRIINGDMVIDQRNNGASFTPTNGSYGLDRWTFAVTQASKFTVQQVSANANTSQGFQQSLRVTSSSAYSITSGDIFYVRQPIEGYNIADLAWGTASAKTVTLSFWVYSSLTGTFGGALQNSAENRSYPFSYTISSANTWEQKTITIPGDTSGTWLTTNGIGLSVIFGLGVGSTYTGTANAWQAAQDFAPTGATSVVGTSGATWYLTGVQLEQGSSATSFEWLPYGLEFINCQRYYQSQLIDIGNSAILSGNVTSGVEYYGSKTLQVAMRGAPTVTWGTQWGVNGFAATAPIASWLGADGFRFYKAANATLSGGYIFQAWTASAEL
jgi:hypothetical protein